MKDLSSLWLFGLPLLPACLLVCWLSDTFETPRPVQEAECRMQIIQACDNGDTEEVKTLLIQWERIRPGKHEPRTAKVTVVEAKR